MSSTMSVRVSNTSSLSATARHRASSLSMRSARSPKVASSRAVKAASSAPIASCGSFLVTIACTSRSTRDTTSFAAPWAPNSTRHSESAGALCSAAPGRALLGGLLTFMKRMTRSAHTFSASSSSCRPMYMSSMRTRRSEASVILPLGDVLASKHRRTRGNMRGRSTACFGFKGRYVRRTSLKTWPGAHSTADASAGGASRTPPQISSYTAVALDRMDARTPQVPPKIEDSKSSSMTKAPTSTRGRRTLARPSCAIISSTSSHKGGVSRGAARRDRNAWITSSSKSVGMHLEPPRLRNPKVLSTTRLWTDPSATAGTSCSSSARVRPFTACFRPPSGSPR
mmetsp:Transcript_6216/g.17361  ORF Transcript_6216/g.17361 Transcript_6216/m.17361 type:complete len:340 (+) Transcript_6216:292-1311(+)